MPRAFAVACPPDGTFDKEILDCLPVNNNMDMHDAVTYTTRMAVLVGENNSRSDQLSMLQHVQLDKSDPDGDQAYEDYLFNADISHDIIDSNDYETMPFYSATNELTGRPFASSLIDYIAVAKTHAASLRSVSSPSGAGFIFKDMDHWKSHQTFTCFSKSGNSKYTMDETLGDCGTFFDKDMDLRAFSITPDRDKCPS